MDKGIFLTIKDLMRITGVENYYSVARAHLAIRDAICKGKRKLTIREYCKYEGLDYDEMLKFLRP